MNNQIKYQALFVINRNAETRLTQHFVFKCFFRLLNTDVKDVLVDVVFLI